MDELLDTAPCGFLRFQDDGTIVTTNATLCEMVGYRRGEIEGANMSTLFARGGNVFFQTHFFPLLRLHGKVEEIYLSVLSKSGERVPVLVNAVRHQLDEGSKSKSEVNDCVLIRMRQRNRFEEEILTQKKAAEEANKIKDETLATLLQTQSDLRARTVELEALMREVPVAIFIGHGADCATITGNPAAHRLLRAPEVPPGESPIEGLVFTLRRDGRVLRDDELPMHKAAATGLAIPDHEWDLVFPDGQQRRILGSAIPLMDESGRPRGSLGTFIDITERKKVEQALQESASLFSALVEQAPTGMYVVDSDLRLKQVNNLALPEFASISPLLERDLSEVMETLWGPEVGGECTGIFRHTLETGERYVSPSFEELRHDLGIEQAYEWETQRVTLPDGQFGVVCYFQEITERVLADRALRESEERMHLATEATAVGIWEWQVPTGQVKWDPQMFRIDGIDPTPDGIVDYSVWREAGLPEDLPEITRGNSERQQVQPRLPDRTEVRWGGALHRGGRSGAP